jgi:DNA primase small subunit
MRSEDRSSDDKWTDLKTEVKAVHKTQQARVRLSFNIIYFNWNDRRFKVPMKHAMEDIILQYTYPRIDAEVSKHRNHLLKAPFCVHPRTGRICVPVDPETIDEFDPELVPTVSQLLRELDAATPAPESAGEEHSGLSPSS